MVILGINGVDEIFHDASASVVVDGKIIASVEEERFNRRKHTNGIPFHAIEYCLRKANVEFSSVDHIGYYLEPNVLRKTCLTDIVANFGCDASRLEYIDKAANSICGIEGQLRRRFAMREDTEFHFLNHHVAHAASAFYISSFASAAVLTVDGSGDRESSALFHGSPAGIKKIHDFLVYPESLGFIYTVFAAHLGLNWISGPGKLMGLAGYGCADPHLLDDIIRLREDPHRPVEIDLSFFEYHLGGPGFSQKGLERFGEPLAEGGTLNQEHCNLAASVQRALERAVLQIVRHVHYFLPEETNLCFSGGVALNVTTNRRIRDIGGFDHFFVTPPAYDGGTSLGCALYLDATLSGRNRYAFDVYTGPDIAQDYDIAAACRHFGEAIQWECIPDAELINRAARSLAEGKFIGWMQGRMECGPRALGNRSILANPMRRDTKDRLNAGIKKREGFRPYAPSVCREECHAWFDLEESPFMLLEARVHAEKRDQIPAVVHIDGTSRPQTVTEGTNARYYRLIRRFHAETGVPIILNTSFNQHGEPLVNRPEEGIAVLLATALDELFIGDYHIRRNPAFTRPLEWVATRAGGVWKSGELMDVVDVQRFTVHNQAQITTARTLRVLTQPQQWSYAVAFPFSLGGLEERIRPSAVLIRLKMKADTGRIGVLFVLDDLTSTVGSAVESQPGDNQPFVDLVLDSVPSSGWVVLRNNATVASAGTVDSIQVFRASRGLPDLS